LATTEAEETAPDKRRGRTRHPSDKVVRQHLKTLPEAGRRYPQIAGNTTHQNKNMRHGKKIEKRNRMKKKINP
jgi:hypothetical protein